MLVEKPRRQPSARGLTGARQRIVAAERAERRRDHRRGDAASPQLHAQPRGAIAAGSARADPLPRECGIVDIAARDEIVHDLGGNFGRRAAPMQPRGEIGARPRAAGQQVARREAGGLGVENLTRRYDFSGAGALRPSVSRILASRSLRTTGLSCSHLRAFSRPWPMRSVL